MQALTREQRQRQIRVISEARAPALYNAARQPPSLFLHPHPSDLPDWSLGSRYTSQGLERQEVHSCAFCRLGADALRGFDMNKGDGGILDDDARLPKD